MTSEQTPDPSSANDPSIRDSDDPVLQHRARVKRWTLLANRSGYLLLALSISIFVIGFAIGFSPGVATAVMITLLASFALLAPSIILGYGVKAAEREDRETAAGRERGTRP